MSALLQVGLPQFQFVSAAPGLFSAAEMDGLIARHAERLDDCGPEQAQAARTAFLKPDEHRWLYERVWAAAQDFNTRAFGLELSGVRRCAVTLVRDGAADEGSHAWRMDFGSQAPERKLSMTVQLSDPADYDGGDLQLSINGVVQTADRERGMAVAFPSFILHRVAPVTRGVRWSLAAWIAGPRWR